MVTFRCKRSGNTVSFDNPDDIAQLRVHESYEEVIENDVRQNANEEREAPQGKDAERKNADAPKKVVKRRGRPSNKA